MGRKESNQTNKQHRTCASRNAFWVHVSTHQRNAIRMASSLAGHRRPIEVPLVSHNGLVGHIGPNGFLLGAYMGPNDVSLVCHSGSNGVSLVARMAFSWGTYGLE